MGRPSVGRLRRWRPWRSRPRPMGHHHGSRCTHRHPRQRSRSVPPRHRAQPRPQPLRDRPVPPHRPAQPLRRRHSTGPAGPRHMGRLVGRSRHRPRHRPPHRRSPCRHSPQYQGPRAPPRSFQHRVRHRHPMLHRPGRRPPQLGHSGHPGRHRSQRPGVINLSLGTLVDLDTGEGAGLQAIFNRVTYAATQAGAVLIASAGNDGVNLTSPRYIELPAQSRGVLAVVASTNPACAENLTPVSMVSAPPASPAPSPSPTTPTSARPSMPSPPPAAAIPTPPPPPPIPPSADGSAAPAPMASPTHPTALHPTPHTASAASTSATPLTSRPWEPAPPPRSSPEPPPCSAPLTPPGRQTRSSPPCGRPPHPTSTLPYAPLLNTPAALP